MINLIPDEIKTNTRFAIKNNRLRRYAIIGLCTTAAIGVLTGFGILGMLNTERNLQKDLDDQNVKLSSLKKTESEGQKLYDQVTTIQQLLKKQIKFSDILPEMAKVLPPGAILKQLDFSATDIANEKTTTTSTGAATATTVATADKPFIIHAAVADRSTASTLLENIRARKDLFKSADLIEVSSTANQNSLGSSSPDTPFSLSTLYPYQVTINAYINKSTALDNSKAVKP